MEIVTLFVIALIGLEHIGIGSFEMFGSPTRQASAFDMPLDFVKQKSAKKSLANQGIYNLMLGILILAIILIFTGTTLRLLMMLLMIFVIIVAIFGSLTATRKIIFLQGLPALIGLVLVMLFYA